MLRSIILGVDKMDLLAGMNAVLRHIENNLTEEIPYDELAKIAGCSVYEFSRLFTFLAGMPVSEYIRRRRLSQAVFDIQNSNDKIIDVALKYQYESPTTFTRAFKEMHGTTPISARKSGVALKTYPPISFALQIKGAGPLNFRIEKRNAFRVIGVAGYMSVEEGQAEPASLWNSEIVFDSRHKQKTNESYELPADVKERYGDISIISVQDTKAKINVGFSGTPKTFTPYITAAIDYKSTGGSVKAVAGVALDELRNGMGGAASQNLLCGISGEVYDEAEFEEVPTADWAVFTFKDRRNAENVSQAYARILTEWFNESGYRRREDIPHLERFILEGDANTTIKTWEIWMPIH